MSKPRSPKYPSMPLDEAIERVSQIHTAERQNTVDRETAAKLIGYRGTSGASDQALGSITQYGLIERSGRGEIRVTDLAVELIAPETEQSSYEALRTAAENPPIFADLFRRYPAGQNIVESAVKNFLIRQNFTENAINSVFRAFIETSGTVAQAKPASPSLQQAENTQNISPKYEQKKPDAPEITNPTIGSISKQVEWMRIPLSNSTEVTLLLKGEMDARSLGHLINILGAHKEFLNEDELKQMLE